MGRRIFDPQEPTKGYVTFGSIERKSGGAGVFTPENAL